jgi:hypothetical protein
VLAGFERVWSIMWAVAKPSILPTMAPRRGNPNWGKLMEPAADLPTAFEEQVEKLEIETPSFWIKPLDQRCGGRGHVPML